MLLTEFEDLSFLGFCVLDTRVLKRARDYHVTDKPKIIFQDCFWFLTHSTTTSNDSFGP